MTRTKVQGGAVQFLAGSALAMGTILTAWRTWGPPPWPLAAAIGVVAALAAVGLVSEQARP